MEGGVSVNCQNHQGDSPLHYGKGCFGGRTEKLIFFLAVVNSNLEIVKWLLDHGANPNILNK